MMAASRGKLAKVLSAAVKKYRSPMGVRNGLEGTIVIFCFDGITCGFGSRRLP